jgi:predicted permease
MRFWGRKAREEELDRELRGHLELESEEQQDIHGARRALGNPALIKEQVRDQWGWAWVDALRKDFRYAFRSLRGSPVFTLVAVASLGLGIGANTAIFSFVNALLLKQLPVPEPARLMQVSEYEDGKLTNTVFSFPFITQTGQNERLFDGVLGRFPVRVNLAASGSAEPLNGEVVTGDYFRTLQVKPALGRLLTQDDVDGAHPVCVISYSLWQARFGGDPHVIGTKLLLNAHPYTVAGVTERGFFGPQLQSRVDMQLPVSRMGDFMGGFFSSGNGGMWKSKGFRWLEPLARLKPGVTAAQAQAMLKPVGPKSKATYRLTDGSQGPNADSTYSKPVMVLMGIVVLVLLIACANLASLLLARANARAKEFAVRLSLGASRWRLVRQLMVESVAIAGCGGLVGLGLGIWIIQTLLTFLNAGKSAGGQLHAGLDPSVIGFSIALSLLTAVLFGLAPAWQSTRPDVVLELKGSTAKAGGFGMRRFLIVFQIALSLVILFAAGLLARTLSSLKTVDLGFDPARVITLNVDPAMNGHTPQESDQLFDEILGRLRAQPGVIAASLAVVTPLSGGMIALDLSVPGHIAKSSDVQTSFNMISPDYFKTLGQPILSGRDFTDHDVKKAPGVAIVNQRFVDQYMPGQNPIGRHIKASGDVEIVGLVRNARYQDLREQFWPLVYLPAKQTQSSSYTLMVRTGLPALAIEKVIRQVDSRLPIYDVLELRDQIDQGMSSERVLSFLSTLFSALATLLCSMGIYGLIAYAVSRRTREIGVRFAIGAQKIDVAKLFLRESIILVAAGIVVGIPLALASTRILKSILYGVAPGDPATLALTVAIFIVAGLAASLLPVLRAARIEPVEALRYE